MGKCWILSLFIDGTAGFRQKGKGKRVRLTREEREMLDGKFGDPVRKAMELLVALGDCYDAEQMVPVRSAHLVSADPVDAGKGGMRFIKDMAEGGGKFVIPTTTNPACLEPWTWKEMGFTEELYREQMVLSEEIAKMGGFLCNTCAPYLIGHAPRMGEHVAWGESSAISYVNAVLGGRTNREGGPTGLAAGLTGRTPAYGYHLDENRHGNLKIMVHADLKGDTDYATLGFFTGKIAQDRVPIFIGISPFISHHELKSLGAGLATSGSVAHYHVIGVTSEAPTEDAASGSRKIGSSDTFEFGLKELKETEENLSKARPEEVDLVVLGCPHASIEQLKNYAETLLGRKVKSNLEIWIHSSHCIKKYAEDIGYAKVIESSGAKLVSNTCVAAMPQDFCRKHGYKVVATDSPKMVYYASTSKDVRCYYGSLDKFIDIITDKMYE
jgi:predicted aconitase